MPLSPSKNGIVTMPTGTVKTFYSERGFGFITRDAGGTEVFFHVDQVDESIEELFRGQRVSFEDGLNQRSGRPEARDVRVVQWLSPLC
jgi:cold shock protein